MTEESTSPFRSFWGNVGIKSSKKIKFMPNVTNLSTDKNKEEANSSKTQKEHRRAQVRKAQKEHRQRKENYTTQLEQDVIRLREMIATAETETTAIKQENSIIKGMLARENIFTTPSSSIISVNFDNSINTRHLYMSSESDPTTTTIVNSPDIFNFPADAFTSLQPEDTSNLAQTQFSHDHSPSNSVPNQPDIPSVGINFILTLEHPCRTHFHAPSTEFDLEAPPGGHELMASALLYSHAPPSVFENFDAASWSAPTLELSQLWQMSQSLSKEDWEITPVQAWFLLTAAYDVNMLFGDGGKKLEVLRRELSELVSCYHFGSVMDEARFWEVVNRVMDENTS